MAYKNLSDLVMQVKDPQKTDQFVRLFRNAVRDGLIEAADLPRQRFVLPKRQRVRGSEGETKEIQVRQMVVKETPELETWLTDTLLYLETLVSRKSSGRVKPTLETIEQGQVDFDELAQATRERLQGRFERGRQLGKSRTKKAGAEPRKK